MATIPSSSSNGERLSSLYVGAKHVKQFAQSRAHQIGALLKDGWLTIFPGRDEQEDEQQENGFFQAFLQITLWLAFAAFLLASLPHVAYFFASFEPQEHNGTINAYWWFVAYALAVSIDVTSFLLSLNVAVKMRKATAGLPWYQKIVPALLVLITHWPFILLLVGFSWLVNFEHAKEFHSAMLSAAETVQVNLFFWQGTLGDLNPVIASAFPVLAVAYTGMADNVGSQKKKKRAQREQDVIVAQTANAAQISPPQNPLTVNGPDWQTVLQSMQEMNLQTLKTIQTMNQQTMQITVEQFTRVTVDAVREVVAQVALPAGSPLPQLEAPAEESVSPRVSTLADEDEKPIGGLRSGNKSPYADQIEALYKATPDITASEIVKQVGCSKPIALKWLNKVRPIAETEELDAVTVTITEE